MCLANDLMPLYNTIENATPSERKCFLPLFGGHLRQSPIVLSSVAIQKVIPSSDTDGMQKRRMQQTTVKRDTL